MRHCKRVVVLERKDMDCKKEYFGTCVELAVKHGKEDIGVGLGAIWNALSKNGGRFENKKCSIYYQPTKKIKRITW